MKFRLLKGQFEYKSLYLSSFSVVIWRIQKKKAHDVLSVRSKKASKKRRLEAKWLAAVCSSVLCNLYWCAAW